MEDDTEISAREAAALLGVDISTVYRYAKQMLLLERKKPYGLLRWRHWYRRSDVAALKERLDRGEVGH